MSPPAAVASAPGKLILMGEHAAVYGSPAVVAAVGLRVRARAAPGRGPAVRLDLASLGHAESTDWPSIVDYARGARERWRRYAAEPGPESFRRARGGDPAHVVKTALGELAEDLGLEAPPGLELRVESELPPGSGFGSSAATAVAVLAAVGAFLGADEDRGRIERLALEVERRQHGSASGVDHRTVLRGGVLRFDPGPSGRLEGSRLEMGGRGLAGFEVFHTGAPAESTGEVVAEVRRRRQADEGRFAEVFDRMGKLVERFASELAADPAAPRDPERLAALVRAYEACLERLGVVPESLRRTIRRLEQRGVAAKISGAGSLSEGGAGCLLTYDGAAPPGPRPELAAFTPYPAALGVEGLRVEPSEVGG